MGKRKLFWGLNFFVLTLFSAYALAGIFGVGASQAYAETLARDKFYQKSKQFIVVNKNADDEEHERDIEQDQDEQGHKRESGLSAALASDEEICSLTDTQAAQLDAFFKVKTFDLTVEGSVVTIAAVSGPRLSRHKLMEFLKATDQDLDCHIVKVRHVFFLPIMPQIS